MCFAKKKNQISPKESYFVFHVLLFINIHIPHAQEKNQQNKGKILPFSSFPPSLSPTTPTSLNQNSHTFGPKTREWNGEFMFALDVVALSFIEVELEAVQDGGHGEIELGPGEAVIEFSGVCFCTRQGGGGGGEVVYVNFW